MVHFVFHFENPLTCLPCRVHLLPSQSLTHVRTLPVGSAFVFSPRLIKMASRQFLAGSLGFSAGVMMYVSFVEILVKSKDAFIEDGTSEGNATLYSTLCFFSGILFMGLLDLAVHKLEGHASAGKPEVSVCGGIHTCVLRKFVRFPARFLTRTLSCRSTRPVEAATDPSKDDMNLK